MSDYMYLLDSHLSREQNQLLTEIQNGAAELGISLYLTGGAMRDMLGGFPIRDLDFTFEGQPPAKLLRLLEKQIPDLTVEEDALRKSAEIRMPSGISASLRMARTQKLAKPGGVPKVSPAQLLEDLAQRDFTVNAIALSLARASRGLIRDPMNGVSDLQNREIRMGYPNSFFDEPIRLLRAIRLRHRLGFQLEERTQRYFNTGVEEGWVKTLTPEDWRQELLLIADEHLASEILRELETAKLLPIEGDPLNLEAVAKFEKLRRTIPGRGTHWPLFLQILTNDMTPKDRTAFLTAFGLGTEALEEAEKIKPRAAKLAADLASAALRKPSQIYNTIAPADPIDILFVLYDSDQPLVQERLSLYLEKYLPEAGEVTDAQVEATGVKPGTAQFRKAKAAMITARLNAPPPPPPPPPGPTGGPMSPAGSPVRAIR
jgi:tRNA nucleotidyltransferase/poly(A) polymerase